MSIAKNIQSTTLELTPKQAREMALLCFADHRNALWSLANQVEALTKERDMLQYEIDAIPGIKAERDALAADAGRYLWMTKHIVSGDMDALEKTFLTIGEEKESITQAEFDAVIDGAIQKAGVQ